MCEIYFMLPKPWQCYRKPSVSKLYRNLEFRNEYKCSKRSRESVEDDNQLQLMWYVSNQRMETPKSSIGSPKPCWSCWNIRRVSESRFEWAALWTSFWVKWEDRNWNKEGIEGFTESGLYSMFWKMKKKLGTIVLHPSHSGAGSISGRSKHLAP